MRVTLRSELASSSSSSLGRGTCSERSMGTRSLVLTTSTEVSLTPVGLATGLAPSGRCEPQCGLGIQLPQSTTIIAKATSMRILVHVYRPIAPYATHAGGDHAPTETNRQRERFRNSRVCAPSEYGCMTVGTQPFTCSMGSNKWPGSHRPHRSAPRRVCSGACRDVLYGRTSLQDPCAPSSHCPT
jgi:hypothetical protein